MEIIESIHDLLSRIRGEDDREQGRPLQITDQELKVLKKLHGTDQWTVLCRLVDRAAKLEAETFLNAEEDPEYARGYIRGVRAIPKIIQFTLTSEDHDERRRSKQRERERRERRRTRDVATYGHPARESTERRARSE